MNARKQKMLNNPAIPTANDRLRALREIEKRSCVSVCVWEVVVLLPR